MSVAAVIAAACSGLIIYSYAIYPVVLGLLARAAARPSTPAPMPDADLPHVDVVIAAHNEQVHIVERIRNLFALDYPADRLHIHIGSDGSTDQTATLIGSIQDPRLHGWCFTENRGKSAVLNDLVGRGSSAVVAFSDANTFYAPDALRRMVEALRDPAVGAACGELNLLDAEGANPDSLYWRIEQYLKEGEARIGALLGANGAIYAVRRECWKNIPDDTICDDFTIAMNVSVGGRKVAYVPSAKATEDTPPDMADEYIRRRRIGIGNYQALFRHPEYLLRTGPATAFSYLSHKVLRWMTPHLFLLAVLVSLPFMWTSLLWCTLVGLAVAGVATGALVYALSHRYPQLIRRLPGIVRMSALFYALNAAFVSGFVRYATGNYSRSWRRTARQT
jgi:cellulose synthase/poly-beta-1,6-N-acetylglucosamine synthase-like glycosyltransferase